MGATFIAFYLAATIGCALGFTQPLPVPYPIILLCILNGTICLRYTVLWLTSRIDTFDPLGLLGTFGIFYYLVSPIIQVGNDYWPFVPRLTYHHGWIIVWCALNSVGLLIFSLIVKVRPHTSAVATKNVWEIDYTRLLVYSLIALAICFAFQMYVFAKFGGVAGFINTFSERQEQGLGRTADDPFQSMGFPMLVAESFKYIFAILCITYFRKYRASRSIAFFCFIMAIFLVVFIIFGGLRGSRSSTVFSLVFAAGIYHFWIRRISIKITLLGIVFVFSFMNAYYWYKIAGANGIAAAFDSSQRQQFSSARQDGNLYVFSRDLGRTDVQTLAMVAREEQGMPLKFGATYFGAPFAIVPKALVSYKPDSLNVAKSDIVFGRGQYNPNYFFTTVILGMVGEAYVNFSYFGILLSYLVLAFIVVNIRKYVYNLALDDARRLLLPVFCLFPVNMLLADSPVLVMFLAKALLFPAIVILASINKRVVQTINAPALAGEDEAPGASQTEVESPRAQGST